MNPLMLPIGLLAVCGVLNITLRSPPARAEVAPCNASYTFGDWKVSATREGTSVWLDPRWDQKDAAQFKAEGQWGHKLKTMRHDVKLQVGGDAFINFILYFEEPVPASGEAVVVFNNRAQNEFGLKGKFSGHIFGFKGGAKALVDFVGPAPKENERIQGVFQVGDSIVAQVFFSPATLYAAYQSGLEQDNRIAALVLAGKCVEDKTAPKAQPLVTDLLGALDAGALTSRPALDSAFLKRSFDATPPHYPWQAVNLPVAQRIARAVSPIDGTYAVRLDTTEISWVKLPWYKKDVFLFRLRDAAWRKAQLAIYYLAKSSDGSGKLDRLNGTSPPIHEHSATSDIEINEKTLPAFLRFFSYFVHGEEGPFYVLESGDDPVLPAAPTKVKADLTKTARPVACKGKNEKGQHICEAIIFYSNAVFEVRFAIAGWGMIEMLSDKGIVSDLPVRVEVPLK